MNKAPGQAACGKTPALAGFWSGGFEGADHVNAAGVPQDLVRSSGHLRHLEEDHARAAAAGLNSVRESIGWRLSEQGDGSIDLSRAERTARSARRQGLQVLWTFMHYGLPAGLSLHDDAFIGRFLRFAVRALEVLAEHSDRAPVITPINEIGFLAWAASQPHLLHAPDNTVGYDDEGVRRRGYAVKCRLVRAALEAMHAMRAIDPRCVFLHAEPVVRVVPPLDRPELSELAQRVGSWQWQVWDLLTGAEQPGLGGHMGSVDLMGLNHYHNSQWELDTTRPLDWHLDDPRRQPLSALMQEAWQRYQKPLVLAETSHVGGGRAAWLHDMAGEVRLLRTAGVPVEGLCLYPLVDRPDWNQPDHWHRSGLWHVQQTHADLPRVLNPAYVGALKTWQQHLPNGPGLTLPVLVVLCHRRWDTAAHRTQQIVQRLAARWRVIWVEEPRAGGEAGQWVQRTGGPNVEVISPCTGDAHAGWGSAQHGLSARLCAQLAREGLRAEAVWLTAPLALPLAQSLNPRCLVHDACGPPGTDEPALRWAERALQQADRVVAEGPARARFLQAASGRTVHRIDNGIDLHPFTRHRHQAPDGHAWASMEERALQCRLPRPRLGYAGAIDARLDLRLIAGVADARPHWSLVMVGPLVGLGTADLPQRPNIHWLGALPHELMPVLMSGWSVGWLPWHTGADTAHANPAQVLEYLACGLPVVAPCIHDLVPWAQAGVRLAHHPSMQLALCECVLAQPLTERAAEQQAALQLLPQRAWSGSVHAAGLLLQAGAPAVPALVSAVDPHPAAARC